MSTILSEQRRYLSVATIVSVLIVVLLMLYGFRSVQEDDSYIFFSYAKNIADGNGYVFNVGERINATTSPLYTLLLAVLYKLFRFLPFVTIPVLGHIIGAVSLFLLCLFLMRAFESERDTLTPYVLPLVFLTSPLLVRAAGMEASLAMMLTVACLQYYARERFVAAALMCSLAVLGRPDMLLLAGTLLVYHLVRYRRLPGIIPVVAFLIPILAWLIFSYTYFGNILPSTLSAKLAQTEAGLWGSGLVWFRGLKYYCFYYGGGITALLTVAVLATGAVILVKQYHRWTICRHPVLHVILLWQILYLVSYGLIMNAPAYSWYYTPLALGAAVLMVLPVEAAYRYLSTQKDMSTNALITGIYLVLFLISLILPVVLSQAPQSAECETYRKAAKWLNDNVDTGSSVGANDIGVLRFYYEKGPVIDAVGLVNPETAEHVRRRDFTWYVHHFQPDYLMFGHAPRGEIEMMVHEEWFADMYSLKTVIETRNRAVGIYQRQQL